MDNSTIANLQRDEAISPSALNAPHYDVISQLLHEWKASDVHPKKFTWVQGHPERRKPKKKWTTLEILNDHADSLCHKMHEIVMEENITMPRIPKFLPQQRISVRSKNRHFIKEKVSQYNMDHHHDSLKEYIKKRNVLNDKEFDQIDWISLGRVFDKSSRCTRIKYTKVIHEKWITLHQQHRNQHHPTGICALCKTCTETQKHVYECLHQKQIEYKKTLLKQFIASLRRAQTPEYLAIFLGQAMFSTQDVVTLYERIQDLVPPSVRDLITTAVTSQTEIGWDCYKKGLVSVKWSKIKTHIMFNTSQKSWSIDCWNQAFLTAILDASIALWKNRCTLLRPTEEDYLHYKRDEADRKLDYYKHKSNRHSIGLYRSLIKHPRGYFQRATLQTTVQWLANLDDALKHTRDYVNRTQPLISKFITRTQRTNHTRPNSNKTGKIPQTKTYHQQTL